MSSFLNDAKNQNLILKEIEKELTLNTVEFQNIKLDFLTVILYGNFEKDLNKIIETKIAANNNFNKNFVTFLRNNDNKLHRGTTKNKFKTFVQQTFGLNITEKINNSEWNIYTKFMDFRHTVAHSTNSYQAKKQQLLSTIHSTDELINILEKILETLNNVKNVKRFL